MEKIQVAPVRKLDDFLLEVDRFRLPDFANLSKWNSRVVGNLLYYQTNYLLSVVVLFALIAMWNPIGLLMGFMALALSVALFLYLKNHRPAVRHFQDHHPVGTVAGVFLTGWMLVYLIDCVAVFLTATLFPLLLMFLHSSCRMRGLRNKLNDALETTGVKKTPMGLVLDFVQVEMEKLE